LEEILWLNNPIPPEHKRYTAHIICDRGVLAEITRHRTLSFSVESSRYCDYSGEMEFVRPCWDTKILSDYSPNCVIDDFNKSCEMIGEIYRFASVCGWKPEQARYFLPQGAKTEMIVTGGISSYENFFMLRCSKAAHPSIREIAIKLRDSKPW
jgi:thymidylate synthase (FAD)